MLASVPRQKSLLDAVDSRAEHEHKMLRLKLIQHENAQRKRLVERVAAMKERYESDASPTATSLAVSDALEAAYTDSLEVGGWSQRRRRRNHSMGARAGVHERARGGGVEPA